MAERRDNPRRAARAAAAEAHTKEMAERFSKEIERAASGVTALEGAPAVPAPEEPNVPAVTVLNATATAAILENGRGYAQFCDLAVLDFASFVTPGGGYIKGFSGQEQALCEDSFLYNVLERQRDWYGENRRRNINCELYRNRALVVPAVRFERDRVHAYADVIVAAAPNARRARSEYKISEDVLVDALRDRVRFVLAIIDSLGREKAVLGAFGCGAFDWDAGVVARVLREELASGVHAVKQVFLAVPSTRYDDHHDVFAHEFSAYPEAPSTTFAEAAAAKASAEAASAAAAAEDDEDEDDWRKYL